VSAAVAVVDLLLVRSANRHKSETGTRLFERGLAAQREGRSPQALELFRSAYNHNPANAEYQLAFAQALDAEGRSREGLAVLEELLRRRPAHGPANAEMARALAGTENWQRAAWYYHRALYGEWNGSPDLRSLRFELADLLARHNAREQLVSEVVLLDAEPTEAAEAKHLARLQVAAGEWQRAETQYRLLLRSSPDDPELLAGLARAQLASGRYVAAERSLRRAISAGASDSTVQRDLDLVTGVNALDPTLRRLAPTEKHRRAHELTSTLVAVLQKCSPENPMLAKSDQELNEHERTRNYLAFAEADLDLFERLWTSREHLCGQRAELPDTVELLARQLTK
jgi:Flp pilus assembly protein TadD